MMLFLSKAAKDLTMVNLVWLILKSVLKTLKRYCIEFC